MYEQIVKYLRNKAAPASASEIVNHVYKIQGGDANTAEKILKPIIKDAEDIYYTENGLIDLKAEFIDPGLEEGRIIFCKILPSKSYSITQWKSVRLALYQNTKELERLIEFEKTPVAELDIVEVANRFKQIRKFIKNSPVVFDGFGNQISLFKRAILELTGKELKNPVISLYRVAKRIFSDIKIKDTGHLSQLLGGSGYEDANADIQFQSLIEEFFNLQRLCYDKDVKSLTELLEFQDIEKIKVDFYDYAFDEAFLENLPASAGVYVMRNKAGQVIYVGKSKNLYNRLNSYFSEIEKLDEKLEKIRSEIYDIEIILTGSELEALLLEQDLIDEYKPPINKQMNVHERFNKARYIYNRILFLPSIVKDTINLYLIKPHAGINRLDLKIDCSNIPGIKEKIVRFFDSNEITDNDKRLDIIASWLYHNEDNVNSIDMRKYADIEDVIRLIKDYIKSLANDFSRVIQY